MSTRRMTQRRLALAIVLSMLASVVVAPARAIAAAGDFAGGPDLFPRYVANDHTPFLLHYSAPAGAGLAPNTTYRVKIRFIGAVKSGPTNRGFTWNAATTRWVQERETASYWAAFPTVTTDGSGAVPSDDAWLYAKFGDDRMSGDYRLMVSLSATGADSTFNSSTLPTITVFDPRAGGSWVHNGSATGAGVAAEARLTDDASTTVLGLYRTEGQLVDEDANGVIDDEDFGPAGSEGDFRLSVAATDTVSVLLSGSPWAPGSPFSPGPADTDLAVGAADHTAPSAPGPLSVVSGDATASIMWSAATDDDGVAGYHVYRWSPIPALTGTVNYTPFHSRVATLGTGARSFTDSGLTNGVTYNYEVRAFDAATNVGPRSTTATATPQVAAPAAIVAPVSPDGDNGWYRSHPTVTLTPSAAGHSVQFAFEATPAAWTTYTAPFEVGDGDHTVYYRESDGVAASVVQTMGLQVDGVAPVATVYAPWFTVQQAGGRTFTASWGGSDAASGIESYEVDRRVGATGDWTVYLPSTTDTRSGAITGVVGAPCYFRVRARDAAGNVGGYATSAGTTFPYDQTRAKYSSGWKTIGASAAYLGSVRRSARSGAYATASTPKGTLYLVVTTGPKGGKVKVYYRGKYVATKSTYSKTTKYRQLVRIGTYTRSSNSFKFTALTSSSRPRVEIDGFAVR